MKPTIKQTLDIRLTTSIRVQVIIFKWLKAKGYTLTPELSLGYCIELLIDFSRNLHKEEIASGVYNYLLQNDESMIAWDGDELIDILFYEAINAIKRKIAIV